MTPSNETTAMRPRPTPIAWTLFTSVVLNLFLVGVFLGVVPHVKHRTFGPMVLSSPHGEYLVDWVSRYLDPGDAATFRDAFKSQADALRQSHDHMHQAIGDLAAVFQQDPPDPAALQAALSRLAQARGEVNDAVGKILLASYTKLSPQGRHRLADMAQNPM